MELRPVTASDVPHVIALVTETLAEFGLEFGKGAATDAQLHGLPESYRGAGGEFFVARVDARLVGTAGVALVEPRVFELRKMYLHRSARGQGVGKLLLDACVSYCRSSGARAVVLDTTEQMTDAIRFYERHGFVRDDSQVRGARCSRGYRLDL
jgi:putative acetyltransferase